MTADRIDDAGTSMDRLRQKLAGHGYTLLDEQWQGWQSSYRIACSAGHAFKRTATLLMYRPLRCELCRQAAALARLHATAAAQGGICLESEYLGSDGKHRFVCQLGHAFSQRASKCHEGYWCHTCAMEVATQRRRLADGLSRLQSVAAQRGGVCLAQQYDGSAARYRFRCQHGHEWEAQGHEVMRGSWCRRCSNEAKRTAYRDPNGLARLRRLAEDQGGRLLSEAYTIARDPYEFVCAQGHTFTTPGSRIILGAWCRQCVYDAKRLGIALMHELAQARGGRCLSTEYHNNNTKLEWECDRGHRWWTRPQAVKAGHWCRDCANLARIHNPKSNVRFKYIADPTVGRVA